VSLAICTERIDPASECFRSWKGAEQHNTADATNAPMKKLKQWRSVESSGKHLSKHPPTECSLASQLARAQQKVPPKVCVQNEKL
jgi:hypothetical protein